jgi:KaiC/GvpD/RAD55 family RecA-like ATPase
VSQRARGPVLALYSGAQEPPHSIDAEQSVLGALLLDNGAFEKVRDAVTDSDFYHDGHQRIFRHIARIIERGEPADMVTVDATIKASEDKDKTGGISYLAALAGNTPSSHNVRRYAEMVAESAERRRGMSAALELHDRFARGDLEDCKAELAERVAAIRTRRSPRRPFDAVWVSEAELPETARWLVKGLIQARDFVAVYGPSGCGKTFLVADLAFRIATGIPWRGRKVRSSLVVYVASEAGASILKRFIAIRETLLGEAAEGSIPLAVLTRGPNLLDPTDVNALIEEIRELSSKAGLAVGLVIFDTLSRSIPGGDENSSEDMTRIVQAADRIRDELSAATGMVHHTGKDSAKGARGHSSLVSAADVVIAVTEKVALVEKVRDGVAGERFPFSLDVVELGRDEDGDPITTCAVKHLEESEAARPRRSDKLPGVARIALQALEEAIAEHGSRLPETSSIPPGMIGVRIDEWRERFALRYGSDGKRDEEAVRKAFRRGKERLQGDPQRVGISEPYCWILK